MLFRTNLLKDASSNYLDLFRLGFWWYMTRKETIILLLYPKLGFLLEASWTNCLSSFFLAKSQGFSCVWFQGQLIQHSCLTLTPTSEKIAKLWEWAVKNKPSRPVQGKKSKIVGKGKIIQIGELQAQGLERKRIPPTWKCFKPCREKKTTPKRDLEVDGTSSRLSIPKRNTGHSFPTWLQTAQLLPFIQARTTGLGRVNSDSATSRGNEGPEEELKTKESRCLSFRCPLVTNKVPHNIFALHYHLLNVIRSFICFSSIQCFCVVTYSSHHRKSWVINYV